MALLSGVARILAAAHRGDDVLGPRLLLSEEGTRRTVRSSVERAGVPTECLFASVKEDWTIHGVGRALGLSAARKQPLFPEDVVAEDGLEPPKRDAVAERARVDDCGRAPVRDREWM